MQTVVTHTLAEARDSENNRMTQPLSSSLPKSGWVQTLVGMLFKPHATLAALGTIPQFWVWMMAVLMIGVVLLMTYTKSYADGWYFYEEQMAYYAQNPSQTRFAPEKPTFAPVMTLVIRIGEGLACLLGSWALWCSGLMLTCLFAKKSDMRFGTVLKLILWSWLPYLVRGLLQSGYMALTHDPIFNPGLSGLILDNTPPSMGQHTYTMTPRSTRLWATLFGYIDLYLFWHITLLVMGVSKFTHLSRKWAWLGVLTLAGVWIALSVWISFARYKY